MTAPPVPTPPDVQRSWADGALTAAGAVLLALAALPVDRTRVGAAETAVSRLVNEVAVLDRFEILAEPGPNSDLTGTAALLVYDITTERTVLVDPAADGAFTKGGMLWWSTGDQDTIVWHTIDLRTV